MPDISLQLARSRRFNPVLLSCLFLLVTALLFFPLLLPSHLNAKTTLKVGVYNNEPTIFVNKSGVVQGLFIDILEDIAVQENWEIEYVVGHFSEMLDSVQAGNIDLLPAVAYSKERGAFVDFTNGTVIANWGEIYSSSNLKITSITELEGQKIAVKQGDIHFFFLEKMLQSFNISCRFIETDEYDTIFEMLDANYVNIGVVNRLFGNDKKSEYRVQDTPIIFNPIEMRFAAPKRKNEAILNKIDVYLTAAKANQNSAYYQAINRWLVINTQKKLPPWIWQLLAGAVGITLLLLTATLLFRDQVKKRTKELSEANQQLQSQIEERQATAENLRKFARIVEASCDAMALIDTEHRHILANRIYRETFAITADKIVGVPIQQLLGAHFFNTKLKEPVLACLMGQVVHVPTMQRKDLKNNCYWNITLSPYHTNNDEIGGYIIDMRDVTEQVEIQNRLDNAEKMEAIGMLAGGVAHDLNNILSGIVSYPDMLLLGKAPDDPMTKPLQTIKKAGERAAAIVQDLLTLARRGVGSEITLNLNEIVNEFINSPEHDDIISNVHGIEFELELATNLLNIRGSAVHLSKILMNLFCNAVEAMPRGGKLTILTVNRSLDHEFVGYEIIPIGEYATISVEDSGVGMSPSELRRIFEPFYTNKIMGRSGTGLGMAVVWGSIKDHKGFIDISSERGKGTLFTLYFPVCRETVTEKDDTLMQSFMGDGQKILVVDDMAEQRLVATNILELLGYVVDVASSGKEAVEKCQGTEFDLLILDMIMPGGMDGLATYQKIITFRPGQKAVIASGFSDSASVRKAQELGAGMYLKKPYTVQALAQAVYHELKNNFVDS